MPDFLTLKKANCRNCYQCIRRCPVKSVRFSGNQSHIVEDECILCGRCYVNCPHDAREIVSETEKVKVLLQSSAPVYVSLGPSFVAYYEGTGFEQMRDAIRKLGFYDVQETALGAVQVKREYDRMLEEDDRDVIISSVCPAINLLIQKHYSAVLPFLADVLSPMQVHCKAIKKAHPEAKTVFIGPCVAQKDEAVHSHELVDAVLTFEELNAWFEKEGIVPEKKRENREDSKTRLFAVTGGVVETMDKNRKDFTYMALDGVEKCMAAIEDIQNGKVHRCFIEMSACPGGCIGGPVIQKAKKSSVQSYMSAVAYAGTKDFEVEQFEPSQLRKHFDHILSSARMPSEEEIQMILRQMGKFSPKDELNCGCCGYNSCREKAVAVYQGKAEISMCMPFLKDKADSLSESVVTNSPNGVVVLNESLEVQQINEAARKLMNLRCASDILGEQVIAVLDPRVFMEVLRTGENVSGRTIYMAEYKRYVEQEVVYDKENHLLICIMRDVTKEEKQRVKKENISHQTVEIADRVVDKQMRIVQEIASLLGETAAETKIALTKLKESISDE